MAVYVDDMEAPFGRMIMCHMIADTDDELHAMATRIGVARRWHQAPPKHDSHYDIAKTKRALAVANGAVEISLRQLAAMSCYRRFTKLPLPKPDAAEELFANLMSERKSTNPAGGSPVNMET